MIIYDYDINIDSTIIENIILTQQGIDANNFDINVQSCEINMHRILLEDLYDNLNTNILKHNKRSRSNKLNTKIDGYLLYSIYSLLAHDYDILNQVFYPQDKYDEIPDDILSNLKDNRGNDIYMDNFTQNYINEIAYLINDIPDSLNNRIHGSNRKSPSPRQNNDMDMDSTDDTDMLLIRRDEREREREEEEKNKEKNDAINYVIEELFTQESFTNISQPNNTNTNIQEVNNKNFEWIDPRSVNAWKILSPNYLDNAHYLDNADYGGTRKNKRKQPKKYKSYNRKNKNAKNKTNRKNKSKNKRKPKKTQRKHR